MQGVCAEIRHLVDFVEQLVAHTKKWILSNVAVEPQALKRRFLVPVI